MKIAILAAMTKELELLQPLLESVTFVEHPDLTYKVGKIGHHEVAIMQCGIGKVNAAINANKLIEYFHPELVVNSGVAGGADATMRIGTLLVATQAAYHDVWCGPGTEYGAADGYPARYQLDLPIIEKAKKLLDSETTRFGLICTGDKFISKPEEIAEIKSHFPDALACDMESAAIAQVCSGMNVAFAVLRVVSDTPGQGENISQYKNFWSDAPRKTFEAVRTLLS